MPVSTEKDRARHDRAGRNRKGQVGQGTVPVRSGQVRSWHDVLALHKKFYWNFIHVCHANDAFRSFLRSTSRRNNVPHILSRNLDLV